ncbi:sulfurtransferase TusA family protein [Methanospirillum lacunae]|uniref:UPF0033 domain-containing protein n=1 Tax=Methanospirillum lacunae TaxID=668570 RepID=A0A2V2NEB2_9EURY|nr:sulfurtransferase TusA family protein [Methanospirillum lacunae]PWR73941.1 hypothetical protein DK846_01890 [Methanospirillum lacunae]
MTKLELNVCGRSCPIPVLETRKKIREMAIGDELLIIVEYPPSKDNIIRFILRERHELCQIQEIDGKYHILIRKNGEINEPKISGFD